MWPLFYQVHQGLSRLPRVSELQRKEGSFPSQCSAAPDLQMHLSPQFADANPSVFSCCLLLLYFPSLVSCTGPQCFPRLCSPSLSSLDVCLTVTSCRLFGVRVRTAEQSEVQHVSGHHGVLPHGTSPASHFSFRPCERSIQLGCGSQANGGGRL